MGTSVCKAVLPFSLNPLLDFDITNPRTHKGIPDYALKAFAFDESREEDDGTPNPTLGKGWNTVMKKGHFPKYQDIYPDVWEKNGKQVCSVNESPFAAGGGCNPVFFSENREALELFKADFGIKQVIEQNTPIVQFL